MSIEVRKDWLALVNEEIVEPDRRIVDPHHHFFAAGGVFPTYDLDSLWADTAGHRVEKTVYVQCWEGYRSSGPDEFKPVGETESVDTVAAAARRQPERAQIAAIVGTTDLRLGTGVREVLQAHCAASALFRGVRQMAAWDRCSEVLSMENVAEGKLYEDLQFRAGFAVLADMGLTFDAWHYHPQTPSLTALARAFPQAGIVLNHLGTPIGVGPYAGRRDEIFKQWARDLSELASCPNVSIKLGGLLMPYNGFGFDKEARPPTSDEIVAKQRQYYEYAIDTFGPSRCMFESNFPVDKGAVSYDVLWNAFKKMASVYSAGEKDELFRGTATRFYRLDA
jgi:L-fuconolactonase